MSSSRSCPTCQLPFPLRAEFENCPVCAAKTTVLLTTPLPSDWEKQLEQFYENASESMEEADRVVANRLKRFRDAGFDWETAARLAGRYQGPDKVDLHTVEEWLAKGCSHAVAAKIVL